MVLVRKQHELSRIDAIEPWLRTVAVNVARDAGRRVTAAGKLDPIRIAKQHSESDREHHDERPARAAAALEIAVSLPANYSEPLMLSLRGLSYRQISQVMDLPETTIQNRLFRARSMVRAELENRSHPPTLKLADAISLTAGDISHG